MPSVQFHPDETPEAPLVKFSPATKKQVAALMKQVGLEFALPPNLIGMRTPGAFIKTHPTPHNRKKTADYSFSSALMEAMK